MEGKRQSVSSTNSFTNDVFESKKPSSPSNGSDSLTGTLGSIFAPPKVLGRDCVRSDMVGTRQQHFANEGWNSIPAAPGKNGERRDGQSERKAYESIDSIFKEDKTHHPCHLSSSIFYGGQDTYSTTQTTGTSNYASSSTTYKKDGGDDDGSASRGNWWQGSLYY